MTLLRGITSKHHGYFYCVNCFHSFATESKFQSHQRVCENRVLCNIIIAFDDTKILELNQYQKSDKAPFIVYADLECIIEEVDGCKHNPENSSTTKVSKHIPSSFSTSFIFSFRNIENNHDAYRDTGSMKKLCEQAMKKKFILKTEKCSH